MRIHIHVCNGINVLNEIRFFGITTTLNGTITTMLSASTSILCACLNVFSPALTLTLHGWYSFKSQSQSLFFNIHMPSAFHSNHISLHVQILLHFIHFVKADMRKRRKKYVKQQRFSHFFWIWKDFSNVTKTLVYNNQMIILIVKHSDNDRRSEKNWFRFFFILSHEVVINMSIFHEK